ncbi:MAG: hypothetical protein WC222_11445 [Parachlamydiales bacterium]|jgi:hypothetical protein
MTTIDPKYYLPKYRLAYKFAVKTSDGVIHQGNDTLALMNDLLWPDCQWKENIPIVLPIPVPLSDRDLTYPARKAEWDAMKNAKRIIYLEAIKTVYPQVQFVLMAYNTRTLWYEVKNEPDNPQYKGFIDRTILVENQDWVMNSMVGMFLSARYQ